MTTNSPIVRGQGRMVTGNVGELGCKRTPITDAMPFLAFMEGLDIDGLDLTRDRSTSQDDDVRSSARKVPIAREPELRLRQDERCVAGGGLEVSCQLEVELPQG